MIESYDHLSFRLQDEFVEGYADRPVPWGFDIGGGNTLGELTWVTKYAQIKPDGTLERWHEGCRRIIEGMFSIQKDWCAEHRTPWNHAKAHRSAEDAYERLFTFRWTPPGRGLERMGTPFVWEEGSASLQNCAFVSTERLGPRQPTLPFCRLMEQSMLGVGVGFDTRGAGSLTISDPTGSPIDFTIPDTREGWVESLDLLLRSYFTPGGKPVHFDYSALRPRGAPLKRLGGVAGGPEILQRMHKEVITVLHGRPEGQRTLGSVEIVDIMNMIARCVVAGNTRRSATLALGDADDKDYLALKDWHRNPTRMGIEGWDDDGNPVWSSEGGWGGQSNNSIIATVGEDYSYLADSIGLNGEPGLVWLDLTRDNGRLCDPSDGRDYRVAGMNPCSEQPLEDHELCTLVESYPYRHDSLEDYHRTLKYAFMYGKTVTLMPTHWPESNEVMQRNRRIGLSITGIAQFIEGRSLSELKRWCDDGYRTVRYYDRVYSEWLGVRESVRVTSVKPSGTVARLPGATPGVHWPTASGTFWRRDRFSANDPVIPFLQDAGYHVEPSVSDPEVDVVATFPTVGHDLRSEREVTVWEKASLAAFMQRWWSDNAVSVTLSFTPDEVAQIPHVLRNFDGMLKTASFLPLADEGGVYAQMPFEHPSDPQRWTDTHEGASAIDWDALYASGRRADGEAGCSTDACEIRSSNAEAERR